MFTKTWKVDFFLNMVSEVTIRKSSEKTLPYAEEVTVQKLFIGLWTVTSNHKSYKILDICRSSLLRIIKREARSKRGMFFTYYWQKPFQHVFVD